MPGNTKVTLILDGEKNDFTMENDSNILDEALSNGIDVPYSCQGGVCLTCMGKVKNGNVEMEENGMLSDDEIDEGLVLTCISKPASDEILIDYDDV
mgnify:FL=1